jgi:membrane fusion protein, heavy metal efflux system
MIETKERSRAEESRAAADEATTTTEAATETAPEVRAEAATEVTTEAAVSPAADAGAEVVTDVRTDEGGRAVPATATVAGARRGGGRAVVYAVAFVAVAALAFVAWWYTRADGGAAGRAVPAPRSVTNIQAETGGAVATSEPTLTVSPEAAAGAGLRVEQVGETLAAGERAPAQLATGVVQANSYRTTPVVSLVGGVVRRVNAELGQHVRRGEPLAVVFSDELAMAQSRYLAALAEEDEQRRRHQRTVKLVEIGAASREELEAATTKIKSAQAEVASLRQRLLLLGLTPQRVEELRTPAQVGSEVTLPAPVSGTVIERAANPGEVVEANKQLLRVADLSTVWVIGQVYEKDLARVRVGSGASVTSDTYPGRVFRGRVSYVDPQLDQATRTAQVRVELANPGQALKIGMYVNVAFAALGGAEATAPSVPASAVQTIGGRQVVFVATADPNTFVVRQVRVGPQSNGRHPVTEGLFVGDRVVTQGSFMLRAEWLKLNPGGGTSAPSQAGGATSPPQHQH